MKQEKNHPNSVKAVLILTSLYALYRAGSLATSNLPTIGKYLIFGLIIIALFAVLGKRIISLLRKSRIFFFESVEKRLNKIMIEDKKNLLLYAIRVAILYLSSILIGMFVIRFTFSYFGYLHIDAESARYMLSTLVQSEAAIVAIVISLSLVTIQLACSSYSIRMMDLLKKYPDFWILLLIYTTAIVYGLSVLILIKNNLDGTSNLENHIYGAYSVGVVAFGFLIPYMRNTLDLLNPSKMIDILAKEVTKEKILDVFKGNPYEDYNIQSYGNRDKDPILPIIDIVHSSLRNYDSVTATQGLHAIGARTNNIFARDDFKDNENEKIARIIIEHLHTVVKHAKKEENDYILLEVIKVLYKNGLVTANKKQENTTILAINELTEILYIVDTNKFMGYYY